MYTYMCVNAKNLSGQFFMMFCDNMPTDLSNQVSLNSINFTTEPNQIYIL
jgi:hypothetical protein